MEQNSNSAPSASQETAAAVAPATSVSTTWPGAFGAFKPSREAVRRNLGTLIWLFIASCIVSVLANAITQHVTVLNVPVYRQLNPITQIFSLLIGAFLLGAETTVFIAGVRGQRVELNDALQAGQKFFVPAILLLVLMYVIGVVSFICLIIPAFIILPRLSLAQYFLVDQKLAPVAAIKASWQATKGNVGKIWGIVGAAIVMILPVFTLIGIIATIYLLVMYSAVSALLYEYIRKNGSAAANQPTGQITA